MNPHALQQLRDVHLPEVPGWWPAAPGWWLLCLLVIAALAFLAWWLRRRHLRRRPYRAAFAELEELARSHDSGDLQAGRFLDALNAVLKRAAIQTYGPTVAGLAGSAWLETLDGACNNTAFTEGPGGVLGNTRFAPDPTFDAQATLSLAQRCVRTWRAEAPSHARARAHATVAS